MLATGGQIKRTFPFVFKRGPQKKGSALAWNDCPKSREKDRVPQSMPGQEEIQLPTAHGIFMMPILC